MKLYFVVVYDHLLKNLAQVAYAIAAETQEEAEAIAIEKAMNEEGMDEPRTDALTFEATYAGDRQGYAHDIHLGSAWKP